MGHEPDRYEEEQADIFNSWFDDHSETLLEDCEECDECIFLDPDDAYDHCHAFKSFTDKRYELWLDSMEEEAWEREQEERMN